MHKCLACNENEGYKLVGIEDPDGVVRAKIFMCPECHNSLKKTGIKSLSVCVELKERVWTYEDMLRECGIRDG
jgi:hypothetical protein